MKNHTPHTKLAFVDQDKQSPPLVEGSPYNIDQFLHHGHSLSVDKTQYSICAPWNSKKLVTV